MTISGPHDFTLERPVSDPIVARNQREVSMNVGWAHYRLISLALRRDLATFERNDEDSPCCLVSNSSLSDLTG